MIQWPSFYLLEYNNSLANQGFGNTAIFYEFKFSWFESSMIVAFRDSYRDCYSDFMNCLKVDVREVFRLPYQIV